MFFYSFTEWKKSVEARTTVLSWSKRWSSYTPMVRLRSLDRLYTKSKIAYFTDQNRLFYKTI